ncbi:5-methylthioadenosine/S-adenosylhomocysteine deaminase [Desulfonispora thiosulfatigenes DSM 11270]|uniref:5-methylthioadenosine/S-adenosylhomocysteine deaminase n=1 Tax=Desulfonispora thiosulfatigenes DSM 11270 TaxID=656914 RepID=A0A1W1UV42_DESTI|nr:amidohydrolase [Desulfonispora thiosulfatigenes]SMB84910.1 5-methylthioadenosine/S-adenosylhomocysteine deaminase [Desulfonispora thiosulfatigenes DSM 11270]
MNQILIKNAYIISMNQEKQVFTNGDILIEDDKIKEIGRVNVEIVGADAEIVDATGKIIMPGLINTHVHLSQQLGRGIADDVDLLTWLRERIWPYESNLTLEDSYISSLACSVELIKSGVTTFAEAGGQEVDGMGRAVTEAGLRAMLTRSTMDCGEGIPKKWQETTEECLEKQIELYERWHNKADGRIKSWFGLRTIFNNTDQLIIKTKELADKYGVGIHMHVAEIEGEVLFAKETKGATTVQHLNNLGVLDKNFLAVHTVWLSDQEVDLFKQHNVKVSHNPGAAMKVVLGFAKVPEMLAKGIPVSIGTDGAPSNNRMDMMGEMYLTSLIHKGRTLDPKAVPAEQVLEMATLNGAKSVLLEDEIGSLEVGKKADLIILNPKSIGSIPMHDPVANIVYAMQSSNVESSMCNGKWLMKERKVLTINEEDIVKEAEQRAKDVIKRAGIILPERFKMI